MVFLIESIIFCLLFTLMIVPAARKNPLSQIYNYPPKIIERVKSLPEYEGKLPTNETKWARKITAGIVFVIIFGVVTYLSGEKEYLGAFLYVYGIWNVVNWYDALILDATLFCHDKHYRLKGTEDMVAEYESPWFHIIGSFKGMVIGLPFCLLSAAVVVLLGCIF